MPSVKYYLNPMCGTFVDVPAFKTQKLQHNTEPIRPRAAGLSTMITQTKTSTNTRGDGKRHGQPVPTHALHATRAHTAAVRREASTCLATGRAQQQQTHQIPIRFESRPRLIHVVNVFTTALKQLRVTLQRITH